MTIARLLSLHLHGAIEVALAAVIMVAAFVLGFEPAALIASLGLGGLMLAVAFATHLGDENALPISTHAAFDTGFAIAMAASAVVFAFSGEGLPALLMGAGALSLTLVSSLTRYSPREA